MIKLNHLQRYLIILLCLTLLLGVAGCKETTLQDVEAKQLLQDKNYSFSTYSSPYLEFKYPSNWELDDGNMEIPDMDTVVVYKGYIKEPFDNNNMAFIMIGRRNDINVKTSVEVRDIALDKLDNLIKKGKCELKGKGIINENIATLDSINWDNNPMRMKTYYYSNGKDRYYIACFCVYNNNWDDSKDILKTFEQTLKFKQ